MLSTIQKRQYRDDGFLVLPEAVPAHLLVELREAADRVTERTRTGGWPHRRAAPGDDIWGVQQLMHPQLGEPVFARYLAAPEVLEVSQELLGAELRLGLLNLLVNPGSSDFQINWHRDLLRRELPPDEEMAVLAQTTGIIQWNSALWDDSCLLIVPGSHRRPSTPQETDAQFHGGGASLDGQMTVELKAGEGAYYNNMLIHRGVYTTGQKRRTLHGALTTTDVGMREIYADGVSWMSQPGFRDSLPLSLQPLYDRWRDYAAGAVTKA